MGLIASLMEKVGFSPTGGAPMMTAPVVLSRDFTTCELDWIEQELRSNNGLATATARKRGIQIDPQVAAANLQ